MVTLKGNKDKIDVLLRKNKRFIEKHKIEVVEGDVKEVVDINKPEAPKRKRRTKAEIEADNNNKNEKDSDNNSDIN